MWPELLLASGIVVELSGMSVAVDRCKGLPRLLDLSNGEVDANVVELIHLLALASDTSAPTLLLSLLLLRDALPSLPLKVLAVAGLASY